MSSEPGRTAVDAMITRVKTLVRSDLPPDLPAGSSAVGVSTLTGRTTTPGDDVERVHRTMTRHGLRRLAVIDEQRRLLGLVGLKRSATGFCDDAGVAARRRERVPSGALLSGRG